jgi:hypothetical protein
MRGLQNVLQRAGWVLPRPFLYIHNFFKIKKEHINPSLLWSKNLALLVLWGLRNPKLFFYLEIKKHFYFQTSRARTRVAVAHQVKWKRKKRESAHF